MSKKYRMRFIPEVEEEIVDYVDPRAESFQSLDQNPKEKIFDSIAVSDLDYAKVNSKNKTYTVQESIYFSSIKEGLGRILILSGNIVSFSVFLIVMALMSNTFIALLNESILKIPNFPDKLLFLITPLVLVVVIVLITIMTFDFTIIIIPILMARKIKSLNTWKNISFYFSLVINLLFLTILIGLYICSNIFHWDLMIEMNGIVFLPFIIYTIIAIVTLLFGYLLLNTSISGIKNKNKRITSFNNKQQTTNNK